jgi:beta-lactamase regulating signal transducer with metallopeptidase domain
MRNFSSMSAIVRALNSPHIQSLPLTRSSFAKGNKKLFKRLTALIAPDRHFQNYREELYSSAKPCVPWLCEC